MTLLNYIHNISQTHLAGHLSPKSRPATPLPSEPVTPIDPEPPVLVYEPTTSESAVDAFVDAPTDPIVEPTPVEPAPAPVPEPEPTPVAVDPIPEEQPVAAEPVAVAPVEAVHAKEASAPILEPEVATATEVKPLVDDVSDSMDSADIQAHKQPTTTHAEAGTLHTATEAATTVDGTPADKPVEETPAVATTEHAAESAAEVKKEEKKVSC